MHYSLQKGLKYLQYVCSGLFNHTREIYTDKFLNTTLQQTVMFKIWLKNDILQDKEYFSKPLLIDINLYKNYHNEVV